MKNDFLDMFSEFAESNETLIKLNHRNIIKHIYNDVFNIYYEDTTFETKIPTELQFLCFENKEKNKFFFVSSYYLSQENDRFLLIKTILDYIKDKVELKLRDYIKSIDLDRVAKTIDIDECYILDPSEIEYKAKRKLIEGYNSESLNVNLRRYVEKIEATLDEIMEASLNDKDIIEKIFKKIIKTHAENLDVVAYENKLLTEKLKQIEENIDIALNEIIKIKKAILSKKMANVEITIKKQKRKFSFKYPTEKLSNSLYYDWMSTSWMTIHDEKLFYSMFGNEATLSPSEIISIKYRNKEIYKR